MVSKPDTTASSTVEGELPLDGSPARRAGWDDAVAIVGVGMRLPGGIRCLDSLWRVLIEERDQVTEVPADRFDFSLFTDPRPGRVGKSYTAAGGFLDDIAGFDADFFGISPKEASRLDPQQRLLLECAVEAFDDAGIDPSGLAGGDTAVVTGVSAHDYGDLQARRMREASAYSISGSTACNTANRLSHFFDLRGTSVAVDTACSSALMAVHQACEEVRSGRSGVALACGVSVLLGPFGFVGFSQASMLSPSGRCRPFSANADGFVRSEGAGVAVLKSLSAALADGDRVHAVIRGSGVNNDGRTAGLALPSADAQAQLLERVYAAAGIDASAVAYVEAHGTGTQAGDPVECAALGRVFGRGGRLLPIGSVKSNLGHLEAAAGIPGLFKAMLVLRERRIPATLHAEPLSRAIDFSALGLEPVTSSRPLGESGLGVVGVNSFGFGGANAHVVLAAPPAAAGPASEAGNRPEEVNAGVGRLPVVVSARTAQALGRAAARFADHLDRERGDGADGAFYDAAFTVCRRRARHEHRVAVVADACEAARALRLVARGEPAAGAVTARGVELGRVGFVFCGNGAPWVGMGAELLAADAAFEAEVVVVDDALSPLLGWSVLEELARPTDIERWAHAEVAQPLLFAVQAGVVAALAARGVRPSVVSGHSVGEVAAAYCAGALDLRAACRVIHERSRAQAVTAGAGRMAAVGAGRERVESWLAEPAFAERLVVAGVNSGRDVTVAGDAHALAALGKRAAEEGVFFRDLALDYAFHSPAMDAARELLKDGLAGLAPTDARMPIVSTVTGTAAAGGSLDAEYWWRNVREPVCFAAAVEELSGAQGCDVLVEIGPHPVLGSYLRRVTEQAPHPVAVVPTMSRAQAGPSALDTTVATLLAVGADFEWERFFPRPGKVVDLPAYPWQREPHWNGAPHWWVEDAAGDGSGHERYALLGSRQASPEPSWQQALEPGREGWLADHTVGDAIVFPAAGYVDMALSAGRSVFHDSPIEVTDLVIDRALTLPFDDPNVQVRTHTTLSAQSGAFTVAARVGGRGEWTEHARGCCRRLLREASASVDVEAIRARLPHTLTADEHYATCARAGLPYGPAFRVLTRLWAGPGEVLASYRTERSSTDRHAVDPTVVDGALQAGLPLLAEMSDGLVPFLPTGIGTVRLHRPLPAVGTIHVRATQTAAPGALWDVSVADAEGVVAMELLGVRLRRFDGARGPRPERLREVLRAAPLPGTEVTSCALPSPARLPRDHARLSELTARWDAGPYSAAQPRLLALAAHFTTAAIRQILPDHDTFTHDDFFASGVDPKYARLLDALLTQAVEQHMVRRVDAGRWQVIADPDPHGIVRSVLHDHPGETVTLQISVGCGRHLAAVLRGERDPLELLFSETDALAARYYDSAPGMSHHNTVVAELLRAAVAGLPADRPLRVLEVGAGTGGTTASLLPVLPHDRTHYTYSDISAAFFPQAEARFAAFDFLEFRTLDLDRDPTEQGMTPGSFDVVIAANVLHATADVTGTVRRVADLLTDGGHLFALEITNQGLLIPTFGLLESFWAGADRELRPDGPLLPRDGWTRLLDECGLDAAVHNADATGVAHTDFSVITAVRRPRPTPVPAAPARVHASARRWILADATPTDPAVGALAAALTTRLAADGPADVTCLSDTSDDPAAWSRALTQGSGSGSGPTDVIVLAGTDDSTLTPAERTDEAVRYCAVLRAVAAGHEQLRNTPPHQEVTLWLVATGPPRDGIAPPPHAGAAAAAWGAARTLANEHPDLTVRRIGLARTDHDELPAAADAWAQQLMHEIDARPPDDEVLLTPRGRFVTRVRPLGETVHTRDRGAQVPFTLALTEPGLRYRLHWEATVAPDPGPGEVVVEVAAAGLNYRDIMTATALVPDLTGVGLECAGIVSAVGPDVHDVAVGDRVAALGEGCLGSHALTRADRVFRIPDTMRFTEAATMPTAFLTVEHALNRLAHLAAGETILVHGATGGVGLAALQYAHHAGARVIATAGTTAKRDLLHLLGVEHVLDSRSLHFADHILDLTGGEGVDVVLNSLNGEALVRSLGVLKPHGRFIELGKRDMLADHTLPMRPLGRNLAFFGMDIFPFVQGPSPLADAHLATISTAAHSGVYRPLAHRTYPADRVDDAFTCLRHSRHIGKVVVTFDTPVPVHTPPAERRLDPQATYLITGGLTGFGATAARHLAAHGARHLTLIGRRGTDTPEAARLLADLRHLGVAVTAHAVDAADPVAMRRVIDDIDTRGQRLAGVVHAAMVLDDAPFTELSDERTRAVLAPKITAGHLLHDLTRERELDFFTVYSSAAALLGNRLQSSYAAANCALDALIRHRLRRGLVGQSLQWGALTGAGYVHRNNLAEQLTSLGIDHISTTEALTAWDELADHPDAGVTTVSRFTGDRLAVFLPTLIAPRTALFVPDRDHGPGPDELRRTIAGADAEQALALIEDALVDILAGVLRTDVERVDRARRLDEIGVDSLMANEFAVLVRERLGCEIPAVELAGMTGLAPLARRVLTHLGHAPAPPDARNPHRREDTPTLDPLQHS